MSREEGEFLGAGEVSGGRGRSFFSRGVMG